MYSKKVLRYKGLQQLHLRVSRYAVRMWVGLGSGVERLNRTQTEFISVEARFQWFRPGFNPDGMESND